MRQPFPERTSTHGGGRDATLTMGAAYPVARPAAETAPSAFARAAKRAIDVAGATFGLVVLSPALLAIAAAVRLDSPGPALFRQTRVGKDGKRFTFFKFRSMRADCDVAVHREHVVALITGAAPDAPGDDGSYKVARDPRVTRLGAFLRRTSIDELPQLINVLRGEMSLVGPRPPLPYEVEVYDPCALRRLEVLPGMTGLWQVSGRTTLSFKEMVDLDLAYIDSWSLGLDLRILGRTFGAVMSEVGAG